MTEQATKNKTALEAAAVTHLEIPTLNNFQDKTGKFYEDIFGWEISWDIMPNYGMTTNTQGKVSIGLPLVEEVTSIGNIYVHVDSIDETLKKVKKWGGKVLSEKNMISEDIGFGATFEDLSGNKIGLFSPS